MLRRKWFRVGRRLTHADAADVEEKGFWRGSGRHCQYANWKLDGWSAVLVSCMLTPGIACLANYHGEIVGGVLLVV